MEASVSINDRHWPDVLGFAWMQTTAGPSPDSRQNGSGLGMAQITDVRRIHVHCHGHREHMGTSNLLMISTRLAETPLSAIQHNSPSELIKEVLWASTG